MGFVSDVKKALGIGEDGKAKQIPLCLRLCLWAIPAA